MKNLILVIMALSLLSCSTLKHQESENLTTVETVDERTWREGKKFAYQYINLTKAPVIPDGTSLVLIVGEHDIAVSKIVIRSNSSWITWSWLSGGLDSEVDMNSGIKLTEIQMNSTVNKSSDTVMLVNPTMGGSWWPQNEKIPLNAFVGAKGYTIMNEKILDERLALQARSKHFFLLNNVDPKATFIEFSIYLERMQRR